MNPKPWNQNKNIFSTFMGSKYIMYKSKNKMNNMINKK